MVNKKNIIGWGSVVFILIAYLLLVLDVFDHKSVIYNSLNLIGGAGLAWRVYQDRNYSNFFLELIFILIAIIGIFKS